jgi:Ca2+-binding EF-hand superfamily protein
MKLITSVLAALALGTTLSFAADEKKPTEPAKTGEAAKGEKKEGKKDPAEAFKKLDTNNDGKISLEEFKASPAGQKDATKAEEIFGKKDKDSDKNLSLEEFSAGGKKDKAK